jgi:N-acetylmuramoyl-L-alanine amidase
MSQENKRLVVLDPGHGGNTPCGKSTPYGIRGPMGSLEKDVVLELARRVAARLGGAAILTRVGDTNLSLANRCALAKRRGAQVFVSLHANAGPAGNRGSEVYVHPRAPVSSRALADALTRELTSFGGSAQGVLAGELAVLSPEWVGPSTAACLLEVDHLSDAQGENRLRDPAALDRLSGSIANGIRRYLGREAVARRYEEAQVAPAVAIGIVGLGIATFSLITGLAHAEAGNLTWSGNITKSIHNYSSGQQPSPWYDHDSPIFQVDAIGGLSAVFAFFALQYRYNGNDIDQCRVYKSASNDFTVSKLSVSFEGSDATSYEVDSVACIMMYLNGTFDPTGAGDIDFSGKILVKADGSCVNQNFEITRGDPTNFTIGVIDNWDWGYRIAKK